MNEKQMQDMAVSILLDEYTQLDVAQLLKEYDEAEENDEVPNVPDELDEECNRMIQREFSKKKQKKLFTRISKALSRVAMITLMLIGLCTVSVLSVKAWRMPVLRFVLETFDRRSSASIEGEVSHTNQTPEEILERLAENIPEDYNLVEKNTKDGYYQVRYMGCAGEIVYLVASECSQGVFFDTEDVACQQIHISGYDAVFVDKNGYTIICVDEERELLIEFRTSHVSEKVFWQIVNKLFE